MLKVKSLNDPITPELFDDIVNNYIYVPKNIFYEQGEEKNCWFGGYAVGHEISKYYYDFSKDEITNEAIIDYYIIFKDSMRYLLSKDSEIYVVTEEEMKDIMVSHAFIEVVGELNNENLYNTGDNYSFFNIGGGAVEGKDQIN